VRAPLKGEKNGKQEFLLILVLAVCSMGSAFALPKFKFSIGAGGYFINDFVGGGAYFKLDNPVHFEQSVESPYFGGAGFIFFDLTYAELSFGYFSAGGKMKIWREVSGHSSLNSSLELSSSYSGMNFGLFLKWPFNIGEKFSIFPLLGADYLFMMSVKIEEAGEVPDPIDFSELWFKAGVGFDWLFTKHIFLRFSALYGLRMPNKFDYDTLDDLESQYKQAQEVFGGSGTLRSNLGHGLTVKLAIGFRF